MILFINIQHTVYVFSFKVQGVTFLFNKIHSAIPGCYEQNGMDREAVLSILGLPETFPL